MVAEPILPLLSELVTMLSFGLVQFLLLASEVNNSVYSCDPAIITKH